MPIKNTKANNEKYQSTMKAFYGAIRAHNNLIQKLLEEGLSLESIDFLFGLKKLDFDQEFHEANPDLNLRYSVGKGLGSGGGIDLPLLTPDQLENIFSTITGTPLARDTRTFNAFLGRLQTRANFINGTTEEKKAYADSILPNYRDTDFSQAFDDLISAFANTPGVLNIHLPSHRGEDYSGAGIITPPAKYYGDYTPENIPINEIFDSLGAFLVDQNEFKKFILVINQNYGLGLKQDDSVQNIISRLKQYYDSLQYDPQYGEQIRQETEKLRNENDPAKASDIIKKIEELQRISGKKFSFAKFLEKYMGGTTVKNINQLKGTILSKGSPEDKKKLIIAIVNIICHGGPDDLTEEFKRILGTQTAKEPHTNISRAINKMLNLQKIKETFGENKGPQPKPAPGNVSDSALTKIQLIIGMIKNYLQTLGYQFENATAQPPSEYAKPEEKRDVDLATQKTPNEQLEAKAGDMYTKITDEIKKNIGTEDPKTVELIISIMTNFYTRLRGEKYNTVIENRAYEIIMSLYDSIKKLIDNKVPSVAVSIGRNEPEPVSRIDAIRNLWNNFSTFISTVNTATNRSFLGELALLVINPNPARLKNTIDKILEDFNMSEGDTMPPQIPPQMPPQTPAQVSAQIPQQTPVQTPEQIPVQAQQPIIDMTSGLSSFPAPVDQKIDIEAYEKMAKEKREQEVYDRLMEILNDEESKIEDITDEELNRFLDDMAKQQIEQKINISKSGIQNLKDSIKTKVQKLKSAFKSRRSQVNVTEEKKIDVDFTEEETKQIQKYADDAIAEDDQLDEVDLYDEIDFSGSPNVGESAIESRLPRMPNISGIRQRLPNMPNMPRIVLPRIPRPRLPESWSRDFRLTRQYLYVTNNNVIRRFNDYNNALYYAQQDAGVDVDRIRIVTRYGLYYRTGSGTPAPRRRRQPRSNLPPLPSGMGGSGGEPDDPDGFDPDIPNAYRGDERFRGLSAKNWCRLLATIVILASGAVTIDDLIKSHQDINKDGTTSPPSSDTDSKTPDVPKVPTKPPSTGGGGGKPSEDFFPDKYSKINHSELWDSIGLGGVIDTYNAYVDEYNEARQNKSLTKSDLKIINNKINNYYGKFAAATNTPTLPELVKAKSIYDNLRKEYDSASEKGLSFSNIIMLYKNLRDAANHVDELTSKYLDIENGIFGTAKSKDDADVTIDDDDYANISAKMTTSLGGKSKLMKPAQSILSKGMIERISRKLNNQSNFTNEELNDFNSFGMVKDYNYPNGLGTIENNPLIRRNKEYEIQQYLKCNPNPKPYIVPSKNKLEQYADADGTKFFKEIQNTDGVYENPFYVAKNKKVTLSNPYDNAGDQFNKSILFNPPINPNVKNVATGSNMIRSGAYYGVNKDPCYQYGNIEYKYNEKLNKYPLTNIEPMEKPIRQYKIASKLVKKSRVPDSYSLK